jgi:hypothetical protein
MSTRYVGTRPTPEYRAWTNIKQRCLRPENPAFGRYGARGIALAPEWVDDFDAFLAHIGPRPSDEHSIDRIDNEKGYFPGNVRWALQKEQMRNMRGNVWLTVNGETRCASEWAEITGVSAGTILYRTHAGWTPAQAVGLEPPVAEPGGHRGCITKAAITVNGVTRNRSDWARRAGVSRETIRQRIAAGWPVELAVTAPRGTAYTVRSGRHRDYARKQDGRHSVPVALRPGQTVAEYAASHGMSVNAFMARARRVGSAELLARQLNDERAARVSPQTTR